MFAKMRPFLATLVLLVATNASAQSAFYEALGGQGDGELSVEINKGTAVRLPAPAASVAVADPNIADVQVISPRMLYVNGRGIGETSLIAVDGSDNIIYETTIDVTHNLSRLKRATQEVSPDNDVVATSTDNAIILKGKVDSPVAAEKIQRLASSFLRGDGQSVINMLDTSATDQVMLKVKIVEVSRNELKRFGINWESVLNPGNFIFGIGQGRDFMDSAGNFTRSSAGDHSLFIGHRTGSHNINAAIDALENDGLVSVLAEPNLTTRSGQTASFLAGGEVPIPVVQATTGTQPVASIEYRQFGVSLQFTPIVMSPDKISLTVLPEVSAISDTNSVDQNGFNVPSFTTRRASTTVDLGTGQTFAIAGLLRNDQGNNVDKFPILGDVPVLGALFRSSEYQNNQTELVILVTPYIVQPVNDPKKFATPLDGYKPATDGERILFGKLHGETKPYANSAKQEPVAVAPSGEPAAPLSQAPTLAPVQSPPPAPASRIGGQAGFLIR